MLAKHLFGQKCTSSLLAQVSLEEHSMLLLGRILFLEQGGQETNDIFMVMNCWTFELPAT